MSESHEDAADARTPNFNTPPAERSSSILVAWIAAAGVVLLVAVGILVAGHKKASPALGTVLPLDPYAPNLVFSSLQMSESSSVAGLKANLHRRLRSQ